jgi:hypothetical protein
LAFAFGPWNRVREARVFVILRLENNRHLIAEVETRKTQLLASAIARLKCVEPKRSALSGFCAANGGSHRNWELCRLSYDERAFVSDALGDFTLS